MKRKMRGWEGVCLTAYLCPAGVLTIGYGHTGPDVKPGMRITRERAVALFDGDVARVASAVARELSPVTVNAAQFDALVSLSFNIGSLAVKAPTLLRKVKANAADASIRDEFMRHVNARVNGKLTKLPGLVSRRLAEADHYFGEI
jgi:lysozyme